MLIIHLILPILTTRIPPRNALVLESMDFNITGWTESEGAKPKNLGQGFWVDPMLKDLVLAILVLILSLNRNIGSVPGPAPARMETPLLCHTEATGWKTQEIALVF